MAASPAILAESAPQLSAAAPQRTLTDHQIAEFSGVFRGRELTRKDRRLSCGIDALDAILNGGIVRGRVSEIVGRSGLGRTSLTASFAAGATRRGEVAAWIDSAGAFDPRSIAAAGADLSRILWVGADGAMLSHDSASSPEREFALARASAMPKARIKSVLLAAEMVLGAGGFGLVVIDLGSHARMLTQSAALRLARAAERSGAAVIVMAERRACGTFAALSLVLGRARPFFSRTAPGAPVLFDGIRVEAYVARNKLGGSGQAAVLRMLVDPTSPAMPTATLAPAQETRIAEAAANNALATPSFPCRFRQPHRIAIVPRRIRCEAREERERTNTPGDVRLSRHGMPHP
jgi:recA bacterial DNA recombination protein